MNHMETEHSKNRPGGEIDSWCGKCKLILAHTIEAMVGNKPARVHCNTCGAQHSYKPHEPGKTASRPGSQHEAGTGSGTQPVRTRASRYKTLLQESNMAAAKNYSPKDKYQPGDVLQHPSFGFGVATAIKDGTKIEVLFEGGSKLLVHGR